MKKNYLILGLLVFGFFTSFAQRKMGEKIDHSEKYSFNLLGTEAVNDTINPAVLPGCVTGPLLVGSANGGYLSGTNGYGDKEKAQALFDAGKGNVYSVLVAFGGKNGTGSGSFTAKVYDYTSSGPGALRSSSNAVSYANIDTTGGLTQFSFATPVSYEWEFFVSAVVDNGQSDSVGIYHTDGMCGGSSAWEMWSDGTWVSFDDPTSWGVDLVLYMFAEVDMTYIGTNEHLIARGSHKVYPNPAKNQAHLIYSLVEEASNVVVDIYSVNGQKVASYERGAETSGLHGFDLNIDQLAAGSYIYTITSDGSAVQGKFVVAE